MITDLVKYVKLDISNKRVFCLSDIHGEYKVLRLLLERNHYNIDEDYLFILGDITRKGSFPLETIRYIMNLSEHKNVIILMGNCDEADIIDVYNNDFDQFIYAVNTKTLVRDLLIEKYKSIPDITKENFKEYQEELKNTKEFIFLKELPHVIITDKYIFSHAKVPQVINLENDSYKNYIRGRDFYTKGHSNPQTVIVGHMPSTIFSPSCYNNNLHYESNMIFIDGGMSIYHSGQMNLMIMENNKIVKEDHDDNLPETICLASQLGEPFARGTRWPDYEITILEIGKYFSKCIVNATNELCLIKNEMICKDSNTTLDDCPGMLINVHKGDIVKVVKTLSGYSLVKKDGIVGWIKNSYLGGVNEI